MYSFHFGGVHCVLGDGVVRCISQPIDIDTMASLIASKGMSSFRSKILRAPMSLGAVWTKTGRCVLLVGNLV